MCNGKMFESRDNCKFSSKDMLEYLENFNYLKEKYLIDDSALLKKPHSLKDASNKVDCRRCPRPI